MKRNHHNHLKTKQGFTLVEAMVSIFISAIVFTGAFSIIHYSLSIMRSTAHWKSALHEARTATEYLRTLEFNDTELSTGTHSTTLSNYGFDFQYTVTAVSGSLTEKIIVVQTSWTNDISQNENLVELSTIVSSTLHN